MFLSNVYGQTDPENKTRPLVHKKTATWCGPCGSWGWDIQKEIKSQNKDKALVLNLHTGGSSLETTLMGSLNDQFESNSGVPNWYVQGKNVTVYSPSGGIYTTTTRDRCKTLTDSIFDLVPDISSSFSFSLDQNTLTINTKTKFFNTVSDEYYLGVYIVEDSVIKRQNTNSGYQDKAHDGILRAIVNGSSGDFGEIISNSGTTNADELKSKIYTYSIPSTYNPKKLYVALMMFKKTGSNYELVNTFNSGTYIKESDPNTKTLTLDCDNVEVSGELTEGMAASSVGFRVPYENTKQGDVVAAYSVNSAGVMGLTAEINETNLMDNGSFDFTISGTPTLNGNAVFNLTLKTESCTVSLPVKEKDSEEEIDSFTATIVLPGTNDDKRKDVSGNFNLEKDKEYTWTVEEVTLPSGWDLVSVCDNNVCWDYPDETSKDFTAKGSSSDDFVKLTITNDLSEGYGYVIVSLSDKDGSNKKNYRYSLMTKSSSSISGTIQSNDYLISYTDKKLSLDKRFIDNNISLYNILGQEVMSERIKSSTLHLNDISNGMYIVNISNNGNTIKRQTIHVE